MKNNRLTNTLLAFNAVLMVLVLVVGVIVYQGVTTVNEKVDSAVETVTDFKNDVVAITQLKVTEIQANAAEETTKYIDSLKQRSVDKIKNYLKKE